MVAEVVPCEMQLDMSCTKFFLKCSCVFPFSKIAAKKKYVKVVWLKMWLSLVECGVLSCNEGRNFCIRDENKMQIATREVCLWQNFLYGEDVEFADYTIFLRADKDMLRERLVDRKEASGNSREKAEEFVDFSDMRNVRLCLEHSLKADLELMLGNGGTFSEIIK